MVPAAAGSLLVQHSIAVVDYFAEDGKGVAIG